MMTSRPRATVSGSFTKQLATVQEAVADLDTLGVEVLSPARPKPRSMLVAPGESEDRGFLLLVSDPIDDVKVNQDNHFRAIQHSHFLWLAIDQPGPYQGYLGESTAMEVGFALAFGVPIFSRVQPRLPDFRDFLPHVRVVPDLAHALEAALAPPPVLLLPGRDFWLEG